MGSGRRHLLVEEAGGRFSHVSGSPFRVEYREVLATNGRVHEKMISLLPS